MSQTMATVLVGVLAMLGTLGGAYLANRKSTALIAYRLEQLEKKVDTHNGYAEKFSDISEDIAVIKNDIKTLYKLREG